MPPTFIPSQAWTLFLYENQLVISGGADEVYVLDEIPSPEWAKTLCEAWETRDLSILEQAPELQSTRQQLIRLGALIPDSPQIKHVHLLSLGSSLLPVQSLLKEISTDTIQWVDEPEQADLVLVLRHHTSWVDTLALYLKAPPKVPHFFIDLAYHHMISLGPYVVPGNTSCIYCLGAQIAKRWGDTPLPQTPMSSQQTMLVSSLIANQLNNIPYSLHMYFERVHSLNHRSLSSQHERVFRWPQCPVCFPKQNGSRSQPIHLPWTQAIHDQ